MKSTTDRLRRNLEKKIATESKKNPKSFWKYVRRQTKASPSFAPLKTEDGNLTDDDKEKAEIWSEIFASVFTEEDVVNIPVPAPKQFEQLLDTIEIYT